MSPEQWAVIITATITLPMWACIGWAFNNTERTETP